MSYCYNFGPGSLAISDTALKTLRKYRQTCWRRREAGGVLLGRHLLDGFDIVIDDVTVPQRNDKRSRFAFFRSRDHQNVVMSRWIASRGTQTYIGLWHTHPEASPTPSSTDIRDWQKACRKDQYFGDRLFFVIMGTKSIGVWQGDPERAIRRIQERQHIDKETL